MQYLRAQGAHARPLQAEQETTRINASATMRKDTNGIVQEWSDGAAQLFGYSAQEMIGRSVLCLFPADRVNEEVVLMQMIQEGQDLSYIETILCHKDGTSLPVALNLSGIWEDSKLVAISSSILHIDQRVYNAQHVQDVLAQAQYLQNIVDHADAAIFSLDTRGIVHSWNPAAQSLFGYAFSDIVGHSVDRLHPLDEHENWLRVMRNMNDDKQVHAADAVRLHKDGTLVHVAMTLTPIVNEAQELIGVNAMMRSIEDKIRARITELTLKRQSKYFEAIVNSSDDAIISNDLHGIVQSWNVSAERLFGYTAKEMIGQSIMTIVGHDKEIEEKRLLDQLIAGTPVTQLNTVRRRKNGTDIHVSISMSTLTDDTDAVVGVSTIARDISDRIVAEQTIWQHANFDILTHLPNQRLLTNRAQQVLPECTRRQEKAAVVYIDIDHLKDINDELGHACGDALLVEVAARMSRAIRMQDTIAHLGGDEFVVLINGFADSNTIDQVVERIQRTLDEPVRVASRNINVSISAGVSVFPDDGLQWVDLMGHADSALYEAKKAGRNRVRYFTQDLKDRANRRRFILKAFQEALGTNELRMHYQPVVDMRDGSIIKAEALVRWTHASGPIVPMEFIPLIEQSDLIHHSLVKGAATNALRFIGGRVN